ncbi:unnamed protein product, partial [Nesidiocoris tenuis]
INSNRASQQSPRWVKNAGVPSGRRTRKTPLWEVLQHKRVRASILEKALLGESRRPQGQSGTIIVLHVPAVSRLACEEDEMSAEFSSWTTLRPDVISKEYVNPICVINMKLRKAVLDDRCVHLKFSSAPLSRFGTDFGAVDIYLRATEPPAVYDWWHPHFYNQQY